MNPVDVTFVTLLSDSSLHLQVLLMVRDPDKWYTSAKNTVWRNHEVHGLSNHTSLSGLGAVASQRSAGT